MRFALKHVGLFLVGPHLKQRNTLSPPTATRLTVDHLPAVGVRKSNAGAMRGLGAGRIFNDYVDGRHQPRAPDVLSGHQRKALTHTSRCARRSLTSVRRTSGISGGLLVWSIAWQFGQTGTRSRDGSMIVPRPTDDTDTT